MVLLSGVIRLVCVRVINWGYKEGFAHWHHGAGVRGCDSRGYKVGVCTPYRLICRGCWFWLYFRDVWEFLLFRIEIFLLVWIEISFLVWIGDCDFVLVWWFEILYWFGFRFRIDLNWWFKISYFLGILTFEFSILFEVVIWVLNIYLWLGWILRNFYRWILEVENV